MNSSQQQPVHFDAFIPPEMAARAEAIGVAKANMGPRNMLLLSILAGAFIAMGAVFATTVTSGAGQSLPFGLVKLVGGLVFCLGLVLVVVAGAELFTGNNLIVMAWANGRVPLRAVLRNWTIVYLGNFIGSMLTAGLVFLSGQYSFGHGLIGANALAIAHAKVQHGFLQAICLGILCNALVCLAVWLTFSARTTTDKILAVIFPITAFVAAGFEHCVANMYFIPIGLFIKAWAPATFWAEAHLSSAFFSKLTWSNFLWTNLLPVTVGNIIGGSLLVGLIYWFIYIRMAKHPIQ